MNASKMLQSDMPYTTLFIYLLIKEKQWYPHVCMNVSTPGKAGILKMNRNQMIKNRFESDAFGVEHGPRLDQSLGDRRGMVWDGCPWRFIW